MNRREFIIGSSAGVTVAAAGILPARSIYFGVDLGAGESFALTPWQRNHLIAIWDASYRGHTADEAIKFLDTMMRRPASPPFEGGQE